MIFRFICSQPIITGQILLNKTENPHSYIVDFNFQKQVIITANNLSNKTKKEAFVPLLSVLRRVIDDVRTYIRKPSCSLNTTFTKWSIMI